MRKLSIITINLNNAAGLEKTIESVINQTFRDFEFIIIDGGSTDNSFDIIQKYERKITYWASEQDKGIYNAMNKGIEKANGVFLQFLNSGDTLIDYDILKKVFQMPIHGEILYGDRFIFRKNRKEISYYPDENSLSVRYLTKTSLCHQSMFFKRDLFTRIGLYSENLIYAADWEFYLKALIIFKFSFQKIDYPIINFDMNGISNIKKFWDKMIEEREKILNANYKYLMIEVERYNKLYYSLPVKIIRKIKKIITFKF
jgi:glycosyltransferase involved in cell wall biosynthesis